MKDIAPRLAVEIQHTLHTQDVRATALQQIRQPSVDLIRIQRPCLLKADRADLRIVMMRAEVALLQQRGPCQAQSEFLGRVLTEYRAVPRALELHEVVRAVLEPEPRELSRRQQREWFQSERVALE